MKVYVNKDKDGKYIAENYEHLYDLRYAEMFNDYEIALCYCPLDCEVVEVQLMETTELQDYTKQVRKEVCDEISKRMANEFPLDENEPMSCFEDHLYYQVLPDIIKGEQNET